MAKALFGHVGVGKDPILLAEVRRLRSRVAELETRLAQAQEINDALAASLPVEDDVRTLVLQPSEPALT